MSLIILSWNALKIEFIALWAQSITKMRARKRRCIGQAAHRIDSSTPTRSLTCSNRYLAVAADRGGSAWNLPRSSPSRMTPSLSHWIIIGSTSSSSNTTISNSSSTSRCSIWEASQLRILTSVCFHHKIIRCKSQHRNVLAEESPITILSLKTNMSGHISSKMAFLNSPCKPLIQHLEIHTT
jgi:hypothetical protein